MVVQALKSCVTESRGFGLVLHEIAPRSGPEINVETGFAKVLKSDQGRIIFQLSFFKSTKSFRTSIGETKLMNAKPAGTFRCSLQGM